MTAGVVLDFVLLLLLGVSQLKCTILEAIIAAEGKDLVLGDSLLAPLLPLTPLPAELEDGFDDGAELPWLLLPTTPPPIVGGDGPFSELAGLLLLLFTLPSEMFTITLSLSFTILLTCFLLGDWLAFGTALLAMMLLVLLLLVLLLLLLPLDSALLEMSISVSSLLSRLIIDEAGDEAIEEGGGAFVAADEDEGEAAEDEEDSIGVFEAVAAALMMNLGVRGTSSTFRGRRCLLNRDYWNCWLNDKGCLKLHCKE